MTDDKPTRREILRPLHLVGLALAAGIFAGLVVLVSTGAFTDRVNTAIANGTYRGLPPITLALIVAGSAFIITLIGLSMLMLAVNPADVVKTIDKPVLYDEQTPDAPASGPLRNADGTEVEGGSGGPAK